MPQLVLLRHGQSQWNADTLFTGWYDVDLTGRATRRRGRRPAAGRRATGPAYSAHVAADQGHRTADLALEAAGRTVLPVRHHWRLNERHYGALQGRNKEETTAGTGWPRSGAAQLRHRPPGGERGSEHHPAGDAGTGTSRSTRRPASASPTCGAGLPTVRRQFPTWWPRAPAWAGAGWAHGNSLRALRKHIDGIWDDEIVDLEIPTGFPFLYQFDDQLTVVSKDYLGDPRGSPGGGRGGAPPGGLTGSPDGENEADGRTTQPEGPLARAGPHVIQVRLSPQTTP